MGSARVPEQAAAEEGSIRRRRKGRAAMVAKAMPSVEPSEGRSVASVRHRSAAQALSVRLRLGHAAPRAAAAGDRPQHQAMAVRAVMVACRAAAEEEVGPAERPQPLAKAAMAVAAKSGSWR